ncbi:sulfurtransferase [Nakamurella antarctica]|uniref:Sulfurtransferase n=1 Tax=Nakamurella antarctica TaxID=1902245 RepID=A0A3G8ZKG3_9ACTN|nr:sulfurtransferase [Nakamurella antarctica]AZI57678.1 sulfurtransferase [Nakamurella antarctica]
MDNVLVAAADLVEEMLGERPPVVLDIRWSLAGSDFEGFAAGHIPGALFVDLDTDLAGEVGDGVQGRHPLPKPEALQATWRKVGIKLGDSVVVYDARDSSAAARAWWLLRWCGIKNVRVLDGGLAAWEAAGLRVKASAGTPNVPGGVRVTAPAMPTVDASQAGALAAGAETALVDARGAARFRGEAEPVDAVAGHIPGAVNLPFTELLHSDGTFKPAGEIAALFRAVGITPGTEAAASCGSGITACHLILGAAVAGIDMALYPGSWSSWVAQELPVETGPARAS